MIKYDFFNKIVLVTASSQGIGYGVAKGFYKAGAKVVICSRTDSNLQKSAKVLSGDDSSRLLSISGDISKLNFLKSLVSDVEQYYKGSIDILVNNSGGPPPKESTSITEEEWKKAIDSNLLSVIRLCSLVLPGMKQKKWGRIINLTSTGAKEPGANMALSNVTRAGVAAYSKTLSREVGKDGITVNTILTGGCLTERFYSLVQKQVEKGGEDKSKVIQKLVQNVPVGYFSTPDEFAQFILFLASEEAGYLTGVSIPVDGGSSKSVF